MSTRKKLISIILVLIFNIGCFAQSNARAVVHFEKNEQFINEKASGAVISIDNSLMSVIFDESQSILILKAKKLEHATVLATFPRKTISSKVSKITDPIWGKGSGIAVEHEDGSRTSVRLFSGMPFLMVHTSVHNSGKEPLVINSLEVLNMDVSLGSQKLMSYGTAGLRKPANTSGSYTFHALVNAETRNGLVTGALTHERGVGVFRPSEKVATKPSLKIQIDFGRLQVNPSETRDTDTMLIGFFEDGRLGLEEYAGSVARYYKIKLAPKPNVYCTWYHAGASSEDKIALNTAFAAANLKPYGLNVMQIDDHWQSILPKNFKHEGEIRRTGPIKVFVDTQGNYSKGMAHTAKMMNAHGMTAGIWFMPFAGNFRNPYFDPDVFAKNADGSAFHDARWSGTCVDATSPKGENFIFSRSKRIYDWGYRYFKIDGMHTGMPSHNIYVHKEYCDQNFGQSILHDRHATHIEAYRRGLMTLRKAAPDAFVLGCNVSQNMMSMGPAFGLIEAMRIGPDNGGGASGKWGGVIAGAWHGTNLYFLNGRIWYNDPDPVYVRASNPTTSAEWMCSWLAVTGGMHTSSEQYTDLPADRLNLLRRCLPSHELAARPVDLFETNNPRIWLVQNDRLNIVGLFNWDQKNVTEIVYDMEKLGLDKSKTYVAFDYWANKFVDPISVRLKQSLPGGTCRVLALRPQTDYPQLLSTSRHITQGLMDVIDEKWDANAKVLSGKSRVVGNDPYELRIVLPANGSWKAAKVTTSKGRIKILEQNQTGIRIQIDSPKSRVLLWAVEF